MLSVDELLDEMDTLLDKATVIPLSGGKAMINTERLNELIEDIRCNLPTEIRQARAIAADRNDIIADARKEAEGITRKAEERARQMVSQEEIVRRATIQANETVAQAQTKSREIRKGAIDYAESIMRKTEDFFTQKLTEIRQARTSLRNTARSDASIVTVGTAEKTERTESADTETQE